MLDILAYILLILLLGNLSGAQPASAPAIPSPGLPFTVEASEDVSSQFPGAPHVQSFSFAQWNGRWVFIGGRIDGYHNMGGGSAEFLPADANREIWVVDTTVKPARTYHLPVAQLPSQLDPVKAQWASTGQLYVQDGDALYISGGYGQDENGKWVTFDLISRANLPQLIDGVMHGKVSAESVAFTRTPLVQSAGGALARLEDGYFYLVMGHSFQGSYTEFEGQGEQNAGRASQTYLNELRKLKIGTDTGGRLNVALIEKFGDETEFHRRDLNLVNVLSPAGLGFAAYGGVFTPETQLSYSKPVYFWAGSHPRVDSSFEQKMNAYTCAVLPIYDKLSQTMYTTFFGGISRYVWDPAAQKFGENPRIGSKSDTVYLDGLQWSDQISTIRKAMAGNETGTIEVVQPGVLPGFVGAGAVFIPAPERERAHPGTDILAFEPLKQAKTFVGYIYGGIRAYPYRFPYLKTAPAHNAGAVPTKPNDLILKVYVQSQFQ